jgi:GNAT superfamily N-acetyltransferase
LSAPHLVTAVGAEDLADQAAELASWCEVDQPTERDVRMSLLRDADQMCLVVKGERDSVEAAAIAVPRFGSAVIKYLAVSPSRRGRGTGGALVAAVEGWAVAQGLGNLLVGPSPPGYLWPGVELGLTSMETFLAGRGWTVAIWAVNQLVDVPGSLPAGKARVADAAEREMVTAFCRKHYPNWETEAGWSFEETSPRCAVWVDGGELLGFSCWSVTREGWFGPMATRPDLRMGGRGIGTGTLSVALRALAEEGRSQAEISWVGPERFYARVAGARAHRAFRAWHKTAAS